MPRYTVEVSRVDFGSQCAGFSRIGEALAAADVAAFSLGGFDAACALREWKREMRRRNARPVSLTYTPGSKAWSVTLRTH